MSGVLLNHTCATSPITLGNFIMLFAVKIEKKGMPLLFVRAVKGFQANLLTEVYSKEGNVFDG